MRLILGTDGHYRIASSVTGEVMHPLQEPLAESYALYIKPTLLDQKVVLWLTENFTKKVITIWDIGLGAATNLAATLKAIQEEVSLKDFHFVIISFEKDLEGLKITFKHRTKFTHLSYLKVRKDPRVKWRLAFGDFTKLPLENVPSPNVIFFDPFSLKTDPAMWEKVTLRRLHVEAKKTRSILVTYGAREAFRESLQLVGFTLSEGPVIGKKHTTIAFSRTPIFSSQT